MPAVCTCRHFPWPMTSAVHIHQIAQTGIRDHLSVSGLSVTVFFLFFSFFLLFLFQLFDLLLHFLNLFFQFFYLVFVMIPDY